jgi:hypothetical protein
MVTVKGSEKNYPNLGKVFYAKAYEALSEKPVRLKKIDVRISNFEWAFRKKTREAEIRTSIFLNRTGFSDSAS